MDKSIIIKLVSESPLSEFWANPIAQRVFALFCCLVCSFSSADEPYDKKDYSEGNYSASYGGEYYGYEYEYDELAAAERESGDARYTVGGKYRQPVDIMFVDEATALVSTKLTGEILELNLGLKTEPTIKTIYEDANSSWGELLRLFPGAVAAIDSKREQVVIFRREADTWLPSDRLDAFGQAHSVAWDASEKTLYASGLWSQRLYRWQLVENEAEGSESWKSLPATDLNMCGGELLVLPRHNLLLVTDAFGRNYRMLDRQSGQIVKSDKVYGHNITALASVHDESMVLFPHQLLSETAQSVRSEITWGGVMSNNLRWLQIDRMRDGTGQEIFKQGRFYPLGSNGNGSGDPTSLAISNDGLLAITLGGTNRVAVGLEDDYYFEQYDVGRRPIACEFTNDQKRLVVVNQFSDSISVVDLESKSIQHISLGALRPPTQEERGEQAFFNSQLSHDGWMSCHSCHSQGHTNGQLNDNFSDHSFGSPKRVLSLLGQAETAPYSWTASMLELELQIAHSIRSTMASDRRVSRTTVADLAAFIRTLPAPPSLSSARRDETAQTAAKTAKGKELFRGLGCQDCHGGKWLTSMENYDVDLVDENGVQRFNPPSLIGVSQRQDVLLHDGRASSLRDLLENYPHQLSKALSRAEVSRLVAYLEQL